MIDPAVAVEVGGRDAERRAELARRCGACAVTSANVPSRLLWYRRLGCGWYAFGVQ